MNVRNGRRDWVMAKLKSKAKGKLDHRDVKARGSLNSGEGIISAGVWGQLRPLDEKARKKIERWGDTLPDLVSPELAGRFEAAYEALGAKVTAGDVVGTNQIVSRLMRAWDVLEEQAEAAGHKPLPPDAYCIDLNGQIVCIAITGVLELRRKHPEWTVYAFEDAARIIRHDWSERFLKDAFKAFPEARVTKVTREPTVPVKWDLGGDEIPF